MTAMKGLDTKRLAKSIGTAEARPNGRCHTLLCLLSALKQSSEKNSQMTDLSPEETLLAGPASVAENGKRTFAGVKPIGSLTAKHTRHQKTRAPRKRGAC